MRPYSRASATRRSYSWRNRIGFGRGLLAALVPEQRHRDGPASVHRADDVVLGVRAPVEEHLVELAPAREHRGSAAPRRRAGPSGTSRNEMPRCLGRVGSVRASTKIQFAWGANEVQIFCPSITHSSPSSAARGRRARGRSPRPARRTPGTSVSSPERMRGRNRRFCSSVPHRSSVLPTILTLTVSLAARPAPPPAANSSTSTTCSSLLRPPPPYSVGQARPSSPCWWSVRRQRVDEPAGFVGRQRADARPVGGQVLGEEPADPVPERLGVGSGAEVHHGRITEKLTNPSS